MKTNKIIKILSVVVFIGLCGCASFEQEKIARVEVMPDVSQYKNKPSVYVDLSFYRGMPEKKPTEIVHAKEKLQPIISGAIEKTALFSDYTFDQDKAESYDYTLRIKAYNHGNAFAAALSGFLTGFTFGVIPGAATDNYTVQIEAVDKNGTSLSKHANDDAVRTWVGIWFIPMMDNTAQKATSNTIENQVITALIELFNGKTLEYSSIKPYIYRI